MRINIDAAHVLSYFLAEHYQEPNNIKINLKKIHASRSSSFISFRKMQRLPCSASHPALYLLGQGKAVAFFSLQQLQLLLDISLW